MHADRERPAIGRVRTMQSPQRTQAVAGGVDAGWRGLAAGDIRLRQRYGGQAAPGYKGSAYLCTLKFCTLLVEAR